MTATLTTLNPTRTIRWRNFNRGGTQIWEATSACGRWTYVRLETAGTPWAVIDNATGAELIWPGSGLSEWFGTLKSARQATAAHLASSAASA